MFSSRNKKNIDRAMYFTQACKCSVYAFCRGEALSYIEDLQRKKEEHLKEEMEEYKEMRKEEKQKEADEIAELKRKRVNST